MMYERMLITKMTWYRARRKRGKKRQCHDV